MSCQASVSCDSPQLSIKDIELNSLNIYRELATNADSYSVATKNNILICSDINKDFCSLIDNKTGRVIVDFNKEAINSNYFMPGVWKCSPSRQYLAWLSDSSGSECYCLTVRSLLTGEIINFDLDYLGNFLEWDDEDNLFFVKKNPITLRECELFKINCNSGKKELIFYEKDVSFKLSLKKTTDQNYIVIDSRSICESESFFISCTDKRSKIYSFLTRSKNLKYRIDHCNGRWVAVGNIFLKKPLIAIFPSDPYSELRIIPLNLNNDTGLSGFKLFGDLLIVNFLSKAQNYFMVYHLKSGELLLEVKSDKAEENTYFYGADNQSIQFVKTSLIKPRELWNITQIGELPVYVRQLDKLDSGHDYNEYVISRVHIPGHDDVSIPISIAHHKSLLLDGTAPALLYAYGAYGISCASDFDDSILPLLKKGFVYVIAHVRGGSENGSFWSENGKREKKENTFSDFQSVREYLVRTRVISGEKVFAKGVSAGGLILGVLANRLENYFAGLILNAPFVNVIDTMSNPDMPGTVTEYDEWGNPHENGMFQYIKNYCPASNISKIKYPSMYITSGVFDTQVSHDHISCWVEKIKLNKTNDSFIFHDIDNYGGHLGRPGQLQRYRSLAKEYAFIFLILGLHQ
jgi:oligopeptidase B